MKQIMKKYRLRQKPNGSVRKNSLGHVKDGTWPPASRRVCHQISKFFDNFEVNSFLLLKNQG